MEASLLVGQVHRVLANIQVYVSARRVCYIKSNLSGVTTFTLYTCNLRMRPPGGDPEKSFFPFSLLIFQATSITAFVMMRKCMCVLIMSCQPLVEFFKKKSITAIYRRFAALRF